MDVKINNLSPNDSIEIIRDIREQGLVQGKDFDFAYHQTTWDKVNYQMIEPEHTVFKFHNDKWATWFSLKYGHRK
jgi:hypothetical protein